VPPIATEFARLVEKERTEDVTGTSGEPQLSGDPVRQIKPEATMFVRDEATAKQSDA
jgi:hypothetical protein